MPQLDQLRARRHPPPPARRRDSRGTGGTPSTTTSRSSRRPARAGRRRRASGAPCRRGTDASCGCPSRAAGRCRARGIRLVERGEQRAVLRVDRRDPAEVLVVPGHLGQPLVGNAAPAGHVAQERHDVVRALGAAERQQQQRVVGGQPRRPWRGSRRRRGRSRRWWPAASPTASRAAVRATGSASVLSQPSGARPSHASSNALKPGMLLAAIVRIGPAAIRFTRMPRGPSSRAR